MRVYSDGDFISMFKEVFKKTMTNEEVVNAYSELVKTLAEAKVNDKSDAEDVYQEVFIRYIDKQPNFRSEDHAQAWFIKVTMNVIRSMHRRFEFSRRSDMEDEAIEWEHSAQTLTGQRVLDERFESMMDSKVDFDSVMSQMKPDYKAVLMLQYDCGYSVREIGKIMGKTETAVKGLIARGKQQFVDLVTKGEKKND